MISIIIPIFNSQKYLRECVDSALFQSFEDLEIILVNDGSTDDSQAICEQYLLKDKRVKLVNQTNRGVSKARENGYGVATGDYILFLDSDDYLELDCCESIFEYSTKNDLDICYFSYSKVYPNKKIPQYGYSQDKIFENDEISDFQRRIVGLIEVELKQPYKIDAFSAMHMKLFKKKLIDQINPSFVDLKKIYHHEDTIFNLEILEGASKIGYINKAYYNYRKEVLNSISTHNDLAYFEKWQVHLDEIEKFIKKNNKPKQFYEAFNNRVALGLIGLFMKLNAAHDSLKKKKHAVNKILQSERYRFALDQLKLEFMPIHWKLFYVFCKNNNTLGIIIMIKLMNYLKSRI